MPLFARNIPRLAVMVLAVAALILIPTEFVARGPGICLWSHLFHTAACPACGSTRALSAFFHGEFGQALAYNRNVMATAPLLLFLLLQDFIALMRRIYRRDSGETGESRTALAVGDKPQTGF